MIKYLLPVDVLCLNHFISKNMNWKQMFDFLQLQNQISDSQIVTEEAWLNSKLDGDFEELSITHVEGHGARHAHQLNHLIDNK